MYLIDFLIYMYVKKKYIKKELPWKYNDEKKYYD